MRLFQNGAVHPSYRQRLRGLRADCQSFGQATEAFLNDRFGAVHFLKPVLDSDPDAFFTTGNDPFAQRLWAQEQGLRTDTPIDQILIAQIEHHRTEVFYNLDPMRYGDDFVARLPGCVRRTVAWRAAPSAGGAFLTYDVIVNNFPSLLEGYRKQGARAEYLTPAHDPEMDSYAARTDRPIDVLFVGTYSRHHSNRALLLDAIAGLDDETSVVMHLDRSRMTRLAETPLGWAGPLARHRRPKAVRAVAKPSVFGRQLLEAIGSAKIVINGAIDMAGGDRGNMRVWEALGCGAAMVSDAGRYPEGLEAGRDFLSYGSVEDAVAQVRVLLGSPERRSSIAKAGHDAIKRSFSKELQWKNFCRIASS